MLTIDRPALSEEHRQKVQACLDILQEAQNLCDTAAQELCSVPGFANEWSKLGSTYTHVRNAWDLVDARRRTMNDRARAGKCPACGRKPRDAARCDCGFPRVPA